jgi:beta-glucosidase
MCLGIDATLEGEEGFLNMFRAGAKADRATPDIPAVQKKLYDAIASKTDKPIVVLLFSGSPTAFKSDRAGAIVQCWYPGGLGGLAVPPLLFGDYSPSGRLPFTVPESYADLPDFRDYNMRGRTYRYMTAPILYPFGYGLSYADFEYTDLKSSDNTVTVTVTNRSGYASYETVQLYIRHQQSDKIPLHSLKAFKTVYLQAGESKTIAFDITPDMLSLFDNDGNKYLPEAPVTILIGGSQPDAVSEVLTGKKISGIMWETGGKPQ